MKHLISLYTACMIIKRIFVATQEGFYWLKSSVNQNHLHIMDQSETIKTSIDNNTYQDWISHGSQWNEEKGIPIFNFKCPSPGDLGNFLPAWNKLWH